MDGGDLDQAEAIIVSVVIDMTKAGRAIKDEADGAFAGRSAEGDGVDFNAVAAGGEANEVIDRVGAVKDEDVVATAAFELIINFFMSELRRLTVVVTRVGTAFSNGELNV